MNKSKPTFAGLSRPFSGAAGKMRPATDDKTDDKAAAVIAQTRDIVLHHRECLNAARSAVDEACHAFAEGRSGQAAALLSALSDTLKTSVEQHDRALREATAAGALVAIADRLGH